MKRSHFLRSVALVCSTLMVLPSKAANILVTTHGNFKKVYLNEYLRNRFYYFLKNVFNLFPEAKLHELISKASIEKSNDEEIYLEIQANLKSITPAFSTITYQLPALLKQKDEMAKQAVELLTANTSYEGYLEIGSSGRYLDRLEESVTIKGKRYYADGKKPGYGVTEMIDRGQICVGAEYVPFTDYTTKYSDFIEDESLELVTNYIGFHHCPIELRTSFISSIRKTMKPGGKLILRDHDCHSENQATVVALAHDVFNMGTKESWEYNKEEIRNFYSLNFIIHFIKNLGFKFEQRTLFQKGDPTKNALMLFTKT